MATYRQLYTSFWQDDFILTLSPTEKYFYIYLMTNSKTNICGIYELPRTVAVMELGLPLAKVLELLSKFEEKYHKIFCSKSTNEIVILNWMKYNDNQSPKVQSAIKSGLEAIKDRDLIQYVYSINTVSIPYGDSIDMVSPYTVHVSVPSPVSVSVPKEPTKTSDRFIKPTAQEVQIYCDERKNGIIGQEFVDSNDARGWVVGKNKTPMKDWKATIRTWENARKETGGANVNGTNRSTPKTTRTFGLNL